MDRARPPVNLMLGRPLGYDGGLDMCCKWTFRAIGFLMALNLLSFTTVRSIEIAHPIEESYQASHEHDESNAVSLVCEPTEQHNHNCLHQHGLSAQAEPPCLIPQTERRAGVSPPAEKSAFLNARNPRLRGPPSRTSI